MPDLTTVIPSLTDAQCTLVVAVLGAGFAALGYVEISALRLRHQRHARKPQGGSVERRAVARRRIADRGARAKIERYTGSVRASRSAAPFAGAADRATDQKQPEYTAPHPRLATHPTLEVRIQRAGEALRPIAASLPQTDGEQQFGSVAVLKEQLGDIFSFMYRETGTYLEAVQSAIGTQVKHQADLISNSSFTARFGRGITQATTSIWCVPHYRDPRRNHHVGTTQGSPHQLPETA